MAKTRQPNKEIVAWDKAQAWISDNKYRFPVVNEDAFSSLKGMKLIADSPFSAISVRREITITFAKQCCAAAAKEMRNTLCHFAEGWALGAKSGHTGKKIDMEQVFSDQINEQQAAFEIMKEAHRKNKYPDCMILDSISGPVSVTRFEKDGPSTTYHLAPKFYFVHIFAILDGEVVPLVKFPDAEKKA